MKMKGYLVTKFINYVGYSEWNRFERYNIIGTLYVPETRLRLNTVFGKIEIFDESELAWIVEHRKDAVKEVAIGQKEIQNLCEIISMEKNISRRLKAIIKEIHIGDVKD